MHTNNTRQEMVISSRVPHCQTKDYPPDMHNNEVHKKCNIILSLQLFKSHGLTDISGVHEKFQSEYN